MDETSSTHAPARVCPVPQAGTARLGVGLLLVLVVPRLIRLLYPRVWVEDDFYLESAYLVSIGMRPYLDFVHPHMPLLEWLVGAYLRLAGASHFSIELLNETAIYVVSVLTFILARRVANRRAAVCAAILYATSSLVFRYHVYERECFVAAAVVGAALLALEARAKWRGRIAVQSLLLLLAALVKLTALIPAVVIVMYTALVRRRWRDALFLAGAIGAGLVAFSAFCYRLYGPEFIFQTFLFHLLKGERAGALYPLQIFDLEVPLFVIGSSALWDRRRMDARIGLVLAMVGAYCIFFGLLSPTAWGHNYLEPLPFIAIISGIGVDWMFEAAPVAAGAAPGEVPRAVFSLAGCGLVLLLGLGWVSPIVNENWLHGSVYGFGFVPREEIAELGAALRAASHPGDEVIAPSFLCLEANRRELVRFPETYGVWRQAELEYHREGLHEAHEHLAKRDFFRLIADTAHFWRAPLMRAIAENEVPAVIPDSPVQLVPLVTPSVLLPSDFPEFLLGAGFRPTLESEHFVLWRRAARPPIQSKWPTVSPISPGRATGALAAASH